MFKLNHTLCLFLCLYGLALFMPDAAVAATKITDTLCAAVEFITTGVGAALATIAIIVIGVGALMGKVSWGMAIIVALGIAIIFGAGEIARALGAPGAEACGLAGGTGGGMQ